jgi:glycosyltransferase involved in cell wall biosynthesis
VTILICSNVYPPNFIGGAELIAHCQAKRMSELGHRVVVFAGEPMHSGERHSLRENRYEGLPVFRVNLYPEDYSSEFVNFHHGCVEEHFERLLDRFSPDVVHMHNIIGLSTGIIYLASRRNIKTVITLHDHWGFCFKNTLIRREGEICDDYSRCRECMTYIADGHRKGIPIRMRKDYMALQFGEVNKFISPSLYLAQAYANAGVPTSKIRVVWYGVDTERLGRAVKTASEGRIRFTFIGYFGRHKGIHVLLNAVSHVKRKDRVEVNLVGEGELFEEIRAQVEGRGLSPIVNFWGKVSNDRIGEVFGHTDVFVLPSIWPENQPITITEAMATRTPVIGSRIGGIPELVQEGRTGYLFEPGDAQDLAEKMSRFIEDRARIREFGENGYAAIKDNTISRQVEKILAIYNE